MAISIDPETGLKRFNTRASKATEKISGKGYSLVDEELLKTLPEQFPGAVFGAQEQAKYKACLLYTSTSPRDATLSRKPSSA